MIARTAAAAIAVALLAACAPDPAPRPAPPPEPDDPRARSQFTIVWNDAAGLDLLSAEGTFVRASVESLRLTAGNGDREAAYPGFWESLRGPAAAYAEGFYELGPDDTLYGVARFEVVTFTGAGPRFDAGVCIYERQLGTDRDGRFVFDRQGSHHWRIAVDRAGPVSPPAAMAGTEPAPQVNVFGGWRTVDWSRPREGETDPCRDRPTPGVDPASWPALMPGSRPFVADAAPEAPNSPGWPSNVT